MRNLFDQYGQIENRLTHALVSALDRDRKLLAQFLARFAPPFAPVATAVEILEQGLPGESMDAMLIGERRGLPDGILRWGDRVLMLEAKLRSRLTPDQLKRHEATLQARGFNGLLGVTITLERQSWVKPPWTSIFWRELYAWLDPLAGSSAWAQELRRYPEIVETRMIAEEKLGGGTLTRFTGVPFGKDRPFSYFEGKRVLKLLRQSLLQDETLTKENRCRRHRERSPHQRRAGAVGRIAAL